MSKESRLYILYLILTDLILYPREEFPFALVEEDDGRVGGDEEGGGGTGNILQQVQLLELDRHLNNTHK